MSERRHLIEINSVPHAQLQLVHEPVLNSFERKTMVSPTGPLELTAALPRSGQRVMQMPNYIQMIGRGRMQDSPVHLRGGRHHSIIVVDAR